jgi:hypothetical protein
LKYRQYLGLRHWVQANKQLWKRVVEGTAEATVVVIENAFYINAIAYRLREAGAELGHDVTFEQILRDGALCMIEHAPVMRLSDLTPGLIGPGKVNPRSYTAEAVYRLIGEKFNVATVFDARAHAMFDMDDLKKAGSTNELFLAPFRSRLILEIDKFERIFDNEHPSSAAMLNEIFGSYDQRSSNIHPTLVSESRSDSNDGLQAANFCAGFASEIMMNAGDDRERDLRRHFRRVIFNGATR